MNFKDKKCKDCVKLKEATERGDRLAVRVSDLLSRVGENIHSRMAADSALVLTLRTQLTATRESNNRLRAHLTSYEAEIQDLRRQLESFVSADRNEWSPWNKVKEQMEINAQLQRKCSDLKREVSYLNYTYRKEEDLKGQLHILKEKYENQCMTIRRLQASEKNALECYRNTLAKLTRVRDAFVSMYNTLKKEEKEDEL